MTASASFRPALTRSLAAALLLPLGLGAQTPARFPTDDPTIRRLWTLGMDSSQVQSLGHRIGISIAVG